MPKEGAGKTEASAPEKSAGAVNDDTRHAKLAAGKRPPKIPAAELLPPSGALPVLRGPATGFQSPLQGDADPAVPALAPVCTMPAPRAGALTKDNSPSHDLAEVPTMAFPVNDGLAAQALAAHPAVPDSPTAALPAILPLATAEGASIAVPKIAAEKNSASPKSLPKKSENFLTFKSEKFLNSDQQALTDVESPVGIAIAKPASEMATLTKFHDSAPHDASAAIGAAEILATSNSARDFSGGDAAAASVQQVAQRAVEAVMSVADLAATRQQHAVNLQFSVNGTPLEVRVEMKAGDVHTTFRTDSSELRTALADAWQSTAVDRSATTRLVPPVFSAGSSSFLNSSAGGDHSPQRKPAQENASSSMAAFPGIVGKSRSQSVAPSLPPRGVVLSSLTTSYLHTFA